MRSRLIALVAGALVVASLWYVQAPPRGAAAYRERAAETAGALRSHVESARLWIAALADGEVTRAATTVALEESEADARGAASAFAAYDPPPGTGALRRELVALGEEAAGVLAALTTINPITVTIVAVVISAALLPLLFLPVLLVANDRELMGELANGRLSNAVGTFVLAASVLVSLAAFPLLVLTRGGTG